MASPAPAGCGRDIELNEALAVTDVLSGYYDNGVKDGKTHFVPSITFRLKNQSAQKVPGIELDVAFWEEGKDGEMDSVSRAGIGADGLAAGASTEPLTVRSNVGFTARRHARRLLHPQPVQGRDRQNVRQAIGQNLSRSANSRWISGSFLTP